jgi:hypothetical protein
VFATLPVVPESTVTEKVAVTDLPGATPKKSHVRLLPDCAKVHVAGVIAVGQAGVPTTVVPAGTVSVISTLPAAVADAEFVAVNEYVIGVEVLPA